MSTHHDIDRSIAAWLAGQVPERASERLLEASRDQIRITRQRRVPWPAWRTPHMNTYAKLAIAAAAVLVVAIVGINLLPGSGSSVGGPAAPASPTPTATPQPSPADIFPQGALAAGRHAAEVSGVGLSFDLPTEGWQVRSADMGVIERTTASGDHGWIAFWRPDNVYVWACASQAMDPATGPGVADLADAMQNVRGTTGATASDATVSGMPATLVELTVLDALDCTEAPLWYANGADGATIRRISSPPNAKVRSWIVEVGGVRLLVDSEQAGSDRELQAEIQQIIDSIQFE